MDHAYFVDPWNFSYVKACDLASRDDESLSYLKFFVENTRVITWRPKFSTVSLNGRFPNLVSSIFNSELESIQCIREMESKVRELINQVYPSSLPSALSNS